MLWRLGQCRGGGGSGGGSGLKINVTYDASVVSAPAAFKTAVQAAVQFFQSTFSENITVSIAFGWGEVHGQAVDAGSIGENSANYDNTYTYQQVRSALNSADASSATVSQAAASLPGSDPTGGATFGMTTAEEKALGLYFGSSFTTDGYVGLSSSATFTFNPNNRAVAGAYDGIAVLEHEIAEVLGRVALTSRQITVGSTSVTVDSPLDLFRYSAAGVHTFQPGPGYFSLDDGAKALKAFNDGTNGGDGGDWAASAQADVSDAFGKPGVLAPMSTVDVRLLELLGYTVSPTAPIFGAPTVGPGVGGAPQAGSGTLTGTTGDDWLQGQAGADTLHGGMGSDYLDGGGGVNTALYDGVYRQYTVTTTGSPATVQGGPEGGTDDLANIQRIQFVDGYLATSPTDTAGQVYRVYEATLNRAPDALGLANWVHALNGGTSLQTVANGFVTSPEFQATYGSLDNPAFVTLLYHNVLHRDPDGPGLANWISALASGQDTRAQVVLGFSESQEDIANLAAPVQQGLWIQDAAAAETARLYDTVFGRLPDVLGLANWTRSLETGTSLQTAAAGFVGSPEFQSTYGALDDHAFLTLLYNNVLHRDPDASGLGSWLGALNSGQSRAQVVLGFSESQEHIAATAPHIDSGIWVAG